MNDTFYYLNYTNERIQGKDYVCIYLLDLEKHLIFRIFKKNTVALEDFLTDNFNIFQDITNLITFAIKSNGKVAIDIKI